MKPYLQAQVREKMQVEQEVVDLIIKLVEQGKYRNHILTSESIQVSIEQNLQPNIKCLVAEVWLRLK